MYTRFVKSEPELTHPSDRDDSLCRSVHRLSLLLDTAGCRQRRECCRLHTRLHTRTRYLSLPRPTSRNILVYRCNSDLQKSVGCCPIRMPSVTNRIGVQCPTRLCMCHSVYPRWPSRTKSLQGCSVPVLKRPGTKLCMSTAGVTCWQWLERSPVRDGMN